MQLLSYNTPVYLPYVITHLQSTAEAVFIIIMSRAGRKVKYLLTMLLLGTVAFVKYSSDVTNFNFIMSSPAPAKWSGMDSMTDKVAKPVVTKATTSIPKVTTVETTGNFSERVRQFTDQLSDIRRRTWQSRGFGEWKDQLHSGPVQVLWGARDDYLDVLAAKYPHVTTVTLPWMSNGERVWNSLTDTVNVPRQTYYEWTTDNTLCTLIETPGGTMHGEI